MSMAMVLFQILVIVFCLQPLATAGKCVGAWSRLSCAGGNGKRSEIGNDREDQRGLAGIPPREVGQSRLRDLLDPRHSSRRRSEPFNISPKQFGFDFHSGIDDANPETRRQDQPVWRDESLGSVLLTDGATDNSQELDDDNPELDDALQKTIEKLRRVQSNSKEIEVV